MGMTDPLGASSGQGLPLSELYSSQGACEAPGTSSLEETDTKYIISSAVILKQL